MDQVNFVQGSLQKFYLVGPSLNTLSYVVFQFDVNNVIAHTKYFAQVNSFLAIFSFFTFGFLVFSGAIKWGPWLRMR